jgi:hypothetical protein
MDTDVRERTLTYLNARHQHPAWLLLASQRAPLVLSCLQTLFDQGRDGVALEDALRALADMLEQYAHNTDLAIENADFYNPVRVGQVQSATVSYRAGGEPVEIPTAWILRNAAEWAAGAVARLKNHWLLGRHRYLGVDDACRCARTSTEP